MKFKANATGPHDHSATLRPSWGRDNLKGDFELWFPLLSPCGPYPPSCGWKDTFWSSSLPKAKPSQGLSAVQTVPGGSPRNHTQEFPITCHWPVWTTWPPPAIVFQLSPLPPLTRYVLDREEIRQNECHSATSHLSHRCQSFLTWCCARGTAPHWSLQQPPNEVVVVPCHRRGTEA